MRFSSISSHQEHFNNDIQIQTIFTDDRPVQRAVGAEELKKMMLENANLMKMSTKNMERGDLWLRMGRLDLWVRQLHEILVIKEQLLLQLFYVVYIPKLPRRLDKGGQTQRKGQDEYKVAKLTGPY